MRLRRSDSWHEQRLKNLSEEQLRREFAAAGRDPAFIADLNETMAAFHSADAETARLLPEFIYQGR